MLKALFSIAFGLTFGVVLLFVGLLASTAFAAPPGPKPYKCSNPVQSALLQVEIDAADEGDVIEVEGDCEGFNYVITTDGLTLRGIDGATQTGDGGAPAFTIAADKVTLEGWAVIDGGAADGILANAGGSAEVRDIPLITGEDGVVVLDGAFVRLINVNIVGVADDGIVLSTNGTARISNTDILQSVGDGMTVVQNGSANIIDTDILDSGRHGVVVAGGGSVQFAGGNKINDSAEVGVFVSNGHVVFSGANTMENNIGVDLRCVNFSRILVFQSIDSDPGVSGAPLGLSPFCALVGAGGVPIFVP